jgi:hypothetical protein
MAGRVTGPPTVTQAEASINEPQAGKRMVAAGAAAIGGVVVGAAAGNQAQKKRAEQESEGEE